MFTDNDLYWKTQVDLWKNIAKQFAESCEVDGFGAVRDAHTGELSQALREYNKAVEDGPK